jgi:hypothetical protein
LASRPPLPEEGPLVAEISSSDLEAPKTVEKRDREEVKNSTKGTGSTQSPPPSDSRVQDEGRKRKRHEDLISSSTSKDGPHHQETILAPQPAPLLFAMAGSDS